MTYLVNKHPPKLLFYTFLFNKKSELWWKRIWTERYQISWKTQPLIRLFFASTPDREDTDKKCTPQKNPGCKKKNLFDFIRIRVKTQALCFSMTSNSTFNFKSWNSLCWSSFICALKIQVEKTRPGCVFFFAIDFFYEIKSTVSCGKKSGVNFGAV